MLVWEDRQTALRSGNRVPRDLNLNAVCRGVASSRPYVNVRGCTEGRDASLVPRVNIQIYYSRNTFILEISVRVRTSYFSCCVVPHLNVVLYINELDGWTGGVRF